MTKQHPDNVYEQGFLCPGRGKILFLGLQRFFLINKYKLKLLIAADCIELCVRAGNSRQYLRGCVGHHKTRHVLRDQRVTSSAIAPHL